MGKKNKQRRKIGPFAPEVLDAVRQGTLMHFNRMEATSRLLETAIRLWFHDGDPLSIHLLASAVCRVLDDLGKRDGHGSMLKPQVADYEVTYDYLRHATPNQPVNLVFPPLINGAMLFDAVECFGRIFGVGTPTMATMRAYIVLCPEIEFQTKPEEWIQRFPQLLPKGIHFDQVRLLPRPAFFATVTMQFEMQARVSGSGNHIKFP